MLLLVNLLRVLELAILIRVLMSWVAPDVRNSQVAWFTRTIDRMLKPFKVIIPMGPAYMDVGPVLALLFLQVLERVLLHFAW